MKIGIPSDNVNATLKKKVTTLKNITKMSQMTLTDPKFDLKNLLDTLNQNFVTFNRGKLSSAVKI